MKRAHLESAVLSIFSFPPCFSLLTCSISAFPYSLSLLPLSHSSLLAPPTHPFLLFSAHKPLNQMLMSVHKAMTTASNCVATLWGHSPATVKWDTCWKWMDSHALSTAPQVRQPETYSILCNHGNTILCVDVKNNEGWHLGFSLLLSVPLKLWIVLPYLKALSIFGWPYNCTARTCICTRHSYHTLHKACFGEGC